MSAYSVTSSFQTRLRTTVAAAYATTTARRSDSRQGRAGCGTSRTGAARRPTARQKRPADGRYASRSAKIVPITNGTFETGKSVPAKKHSPNAARGRLFHSTRARTAAKAVPARPTQAAGSRSDRASGSAYAEWSADRYTGRNVFPA